MTICMDTQILIEEPESHTHSFTRDLNQEVEVEAEH